MAQELETTYYRFLSEVKAFLSKLIKNPIKAEPNKYLKDRKFTKTKLINVLIKKDVLERHEKILDSTNSDEKEAKYVVKYKVKKKDFENKIHKIYIKYFEENLPEKKDINESFFANEEEMKEQILNSKDGKIYKERGGIKECDCGGCMGGPGAATCNDSAPTMPLAKPIRRKIKEGKRVYITEEQFEALQKQLNEISTSDVGAMGDYTASGLQIDKNDPTIKGREIKVKQFHE